MTRQEAFVQHFLVPLVCGGELHIGAPLTLDDLDWLADIPSSALTRIELEKRVLAQRWTRRPLHIPPWNADKNQQKMTFGIYNLLFLSHPVTQSLTMSKRALNKLIQCTQSTVGDVADNCGTEDAIARHALLRNLPRLSRKDTTVLWWSGSETFQGCEVPRRLLSYPKLRRVSTQENIAHWKEILPRDVQAELWSHLFWKSPLDNYTTTERLAPFQISPLTLQDPDILREISAHWLQDSLWEFSAAFVDAFWKELAHDRLDNIGLKKQTLFSVVMLFYHTHMLRRYHANPDDDFKNLNSVQSALREPVYKLLALLQHLEEHEQLFGIPNLLQGKEETPLSLSIRRLLSYGLSLWKEDEIQTQKDKLLSVLQ